jgi:ABC-type bacteriocin/lantibiotic exporter with double-glycine peptidase domain
MSSSLFSNLNLDEFKTILGPHNSGKNTINHGIIKDLHSSSPFSYIKCLSEALDQLGVNFHSELVAGTSLEDSLKLNAIRYRSIELESFSNNVDFGLLITSNDDSSTFSIVENRASVAKILEFSDANDEYQLVKNISSFEYLSTCGSIYEIYPPLPFSLNSLSEFLKFVFVNYERDLIIVLLFSALANTLQLSFPSLTTYVTTTVLNLGSTSFVLQIGFLAIILTFLSVTCLFLQSRFILKLEAESDKRAQVSVWDRLLKADLDLLTKYSHVDLAQRAFAVSKIKELFSSSNIIALVNIIFSLFYLVIMYTYDSNALLSILPIVISFILIIYFKSRSGGELLANSLACSARVTSEGREILHSLPELRARGLQDIFLQKWSDYVVQLSKFGGKSRVKDNYIEVASQAFQPLCFLVSFIVIFYRMDEYSDTQSLVQLLGYVSALTLFTTNLSSGSATLADQITSVFAYWSRSQPVIFSAIEPGYGPNTKTPNIEGNIVVHNLSYSIGEKVIFSNKNYSFPASTITLIKSSPSSGMSSFFNVLIGLYKSSHGYISYENTRLENIQISYLRSKVMLSPQLPFIPLGPLGELFDSPFTSDDNNLSELLQLLQLDKLVSSLRMGLNTPIPQGGTCFSSKQQQLLSLGRCLKAHSPIIILDNCMSTLSIEEVTLILLYLKKYSITTLINDHRISSSDFAFDQVLDFNS